MFLIISRLRNAVDALVQSGKYRQDIPVYIDGVPAKGVQIEYAGAGKDRVATAINIKTEKRDEVSKD